MIKFSITVKQNGEEIKEYSFCLREGERLVVGRSACDVSLYDPRVSQEHFSIENNAEQLLVKDLESANHTWVDGIPIKNYSVRMPTKIVIGDNELLVGSPEIIDEANELPVEEKEAAVELTAGRSPTVFGHIEDSPMFIEKAFTAPQRQEGQDSEVEHKKSLSEHIWYFLAYARAWFMGPHALCEYIQSHALPRFRAWFVFSAVVMVLIQALRYDSWFSVSLFLLPGLVFSSLVHVFIGLFFLQLFWMNGIDTSFKLGSLFKGCEGQEGAGWRLKFVFYVICCLPLVCLAVISLRGLEGFRFVVCLAAALFYRHYLLVLTKELFGYNLEHSKKRMYSYIPLVYSFILFYVFAVIF